MRSLLMLLIAFVASTQVRTEHIAAPTALCFALPQLRSGWEVSFHSASGTILDGADHISLPCLSAFAYLIRGAGPSAADCQPPES